MAEKTVDSVPFIYAPVQPGNQYLARYDQTKSEFMGIVDSAEDRLDSSFTEIRNRINDLKNLTIGNIPDPDTAVAPPTFSQPPALDDIGFDYQEPNDDFTLGNFVVPTAPTLPTLELPEGIDPTVLDNISINLPTPPSVTAVTVNIPNIDIGTFDPGVTLTAPPNFGALTLPNKPAQGTVPTITVDIPDVSGYIGTIPDAPNISIDLKDDDFYSVDIPTFSTIDIPNIPLVDYEVFALGEFTSCIKDELCTSLKGMLEKASLDKEYEVASFDAALEREHDAFNATVGELPASWAARGYMMPPGGLARMEHRSQQESMRRLKEGSRELYTRRRELDLQVRGQALSASASLYSAEVNEYQITQQLKLSQLQYIQELSIKVYEQAIKAATLQSEKVRAEQAAFNATLEGKKALWNAEEVRIRAKVSQAELYKAQVAGIEAQSRTAGIILDTTRTELQIQVEQARATIENNKTLLDGWRAEVEGLVTAYRAKSVYADIIRAQATVIGANAQAFQAKATAKQLQLEGAIKQADANIKVQELNNSIYQTQAAGERVRVEAEISLAKARADIAQAIVELATRKASAIASQYQSQSQLTSSVIQAAGTAYQSAASAALAKNNAKASFFNAVSSYVNAKTAESRGKIDLYRTELDAQITFYKGRINEASDRYTKTISAWNAAFTRRVSAVTAGINAAVESAKIPAELIKSAMSAFVINLGSNEQVQFSKTETYSAALYNNYNEQVTTRQSDNLI